MAELIENIDFRIQGYHKKETFDTNGDLTVIEYYKNYDSGTDTFTNLRVKETRVYTRDDTTGFLVQRDNTIEWYNSGGVVAATKTTTKYYTDQKGYVANKTARQNIIDNVAMYLVTEVSVLDSKAFWKTVRDEVNDYVDASEVTALITAVNNSGEAYMTATIKAAIVVLIDITYIPA